MGQWLAICRNVDITGGARQRNYELEGGGGEAGGSGGGPLGVNNHNQKTYSWDQRSAMNQDSFIFDGLTNCSAVKTGGSINGQQFVIQNCANATIYLLDHSATVNIDDCLDCVIVVGPCKGSLFIRDCSNIRLLALCQQFRSRDCHNVDAFLYSTTMPIIEESKQMRFGCAQISYPHLAEQIHAAGLTIFTNNWSTVHDFTPEPGNYQIVSASSTDIASIMRPNVTIEPDDQAHKAMSSLSFARERSCIPWTPSNSQAANCEEDTSTEPVFVLVMTDEKHPSSNATKSLQHRCQLAVTQLQFPAHATTPHCRLIACRQAKVDASDVKRLTGEERYAKYAGRGESIGMYLRGSKGCAAVVRGILETHELHDHSTLIVEGEGSKTLWSSFRQFTEIQYSV